MKVSFKVRRGTYMIDVFADVYDTFLTMKYSTDAVALEDFDMNHSVSVLIHNNLMTIAHRDLARNGI